MMQYFLSLRCIKIACTDKVTMFLTDKYYAIEPALCVGIEVQVTFC
jgi:hypothetical protein